MIEMYVRREDDVDVSGRDSNVGHRVGQPAVREERAILRADARIDEDRLAARPHEEARYRELEARAVGLEVLAVRLPIFRRLIRKQHLTRRFRVCIQQRRDLNVAYVQYVPTHLASIFCVAVLARSRAHSCA